MISIPASPGTYALILQVDHPLLLQVGRLGVFTFPAGYYVYLGSAFGPGGLKTRLGRHLYGTGRVHWHIDYLRSNARIAGFCYSLSSTPLECLWSQALALESGAWIPAPGLGASDCRALPEGCPAHLVMLGRPVLALDLARMIAFASDAPVRFEVVPEPT